MGNKQKNSKTTFQEKKLINQNIYLLCPNCFKKVPIINTFIEGENVKIKISCSCLEKDNFLIMNLIEYLSTVNNITHNNCCLYHEKQIGKKFCINCENWLCEDCFKNHSIKICEKEYYNINNDNDIGNILFCNNHNKKKIYLCKKCLIPFCKTCFTHHNIRNKILHKGANIESYLTEEKIQTKYNKYQTYVNNILELKSAMKDDLLKDFYSKEKENNINENNENKMYIINFQEKYIIHKTINEQLILLLELILKNCEYIKDDFIINRKFIYDVIINTKINKIYPKLDKKLPIIEQIKSFTNYIQVNYINKKQDYSLKIINKIEKSNCIIEKLLSITYDKFVIITKDCEIQIYQRQYSDKNKSFENVFTFNEHTNNITCIISLRNKKYFATASDDRTIKIWDSENGICIKTINVEGKPFLIYEKYGNENELGCVPNRNSLSIYKYDEKSQNIIFTKSLEKYIPWIEGLYQLPSDGRIIISSSGNFEVFTPDLNEIKKIYIAKRIPRNFLQLMNNDLVVGFSSNEVFIYDNSINFKRKLIGHKKNITSFLQLDDNKLLTASLDSHIILWTIDNYEMIFTFINNNLGINSMILINQNRIITCSFSKTNFIEEWEIEENCKL